MSNLSLSLLGSFEAVLNGEPLKKFRTNKVQALLIYLAAEPAASHRRDELMKLLWPGLPIKSAQVNLRQVIYHLRKAVPDLSVTGEEEMLSFLQTEYRTVSLDPAYPWEVDTGAFDNLLSKALTHDHRDLLTCDPCLALLKDAADLYRGPFLADFWLDDSDLYADWALAKRESYRRQVLDALDTLTTATLHSGSYQKAETDARRQLEIDELRESAHRQLMEALARSGRREEALAQYERCQRQLRDELGMAPSARTMALYGRIAAGEVDLEAPIAPSIRGYELLEEIGAGAFGAVHKAYQPAVDRQVAVKIILPQYANQPEFIRRFEVEAQTVARLEHPYIVPLYDYWREPNGAYLVMRYLQGGSLSRSLAAGESWTGERAVQLVEQVASALDAAHRQGVVHRDIKPANILLDTEGNGFLSDFGIAKDILLGDGDRGLGDGGSVTGSPAYISPEQILDEPVTAKSDIYSLGLVMYELLTGEVAYPEESITALLHQQLSEPVPLLMDRLPELPADVDAVIQRATTKRPSDRYADALELARAFREAMAVPITAPVPWMPAAPDEELVNPYKGLRAFQEADAGDFFGREALVSQLLDRMGGSQISTNGKSLSGSAQASSMSRSAQASSISRSVQASSMSRSVQASSMSRSVQASSMSRSVQASSMSRSAQASSMSRSAQASSMSRSAQANFLAVVGPSGSGKSSAVKAGLIPALRSGALPGSEKWFIVEMAPGRRPLEELEAGLLPVAVDPPASLLEPLQKDDRGFIRTLKRILPPGGGEPSQLLLVVDQFEELFTLVEDEDERAHFIDSLLTALEEPRSPLRVLVTMRADFYDRPLAYQKLGELLRARTELVLPMSAEELERAICEPAIGAGAAVDPGLVATIISDVQEQPGMLPLLQYALTELFERRQDDILSQKAYREIGGVAGALGRRAEEIYASLFDEAQALARQVFLRLVTLGEGIEDTRRRVLRTELEQLATDDISGFNQVVDAYGLARLLTFDRDPSSREPTIEVAHEALLREWERLRVWLDESRDDVRLQRLLGAAAAEWLQSEQDPGFLLRESRLTQFEDWAAATDLALTGGERDFLDASLAERRVREAAEVERQAHEAELERRSRNRLRAMVGIFAVAAVIAVALSLFAFNQQAAAQENEALAIEGQATATVAQGEAIFQAATATVSQGEAVLQAATAEAERVRAEGEAAARATAQANAEDQKTIAEDQRVIAEDEARAALEAYSMSLAAHAQKALDELDSGSALTLALAASSIEDPPKEVVQTLQHAAYAPGARRQYTVTNELGEVREIYSMAISPDGTNTLLGLDDGTIVLLNIESGHASYPFVGHTEAVSSLAYSPDGSRVLTGGCDTELILWDVTTGDEIQRIIEHTGCVHAVDFSPGGRTAVSGGFAGLALEDIFVPGDLFLWDLDSGELIHRFEGGHLYGLLSAAISPDGRTLLSGEYSAQYAGPPSDPLILWDLESGEIIHRFPAEAEAVKSLVFHPNGRTAFHAVWDSIHQWDLESGEEVRVFEGHGEIVSTIDISPDGRRMISIEVGGGAILWDLASGEPLARFTHGDLDHFIAFTSDNRTALSASSDGTVVLWDLFNANEVRRFEGGQGIVSAVAFTPDGKTIVSGHYDYPPGVGNSIRVWDVETGEQTQVLEGHTEGIFAVKVSPDGRRAISISDDDSARLWDLESGEEIWRMDAHKPFVAAFHPDGRRALIGTSDPSAIMWDLESGEIVDHIIGHQGWVFGVAVSPDGKTALTSDHLAELILWDLGSGQQIRSISLDRGAQIFSVAFSPDGRHAISQSRIRNVVVWDTETWEIERVFTENEGMSHFGRLDIGPDGRTIVSADIEGNVLVWDWVNDEIIHSYSSPTHMQVKPAISPDGRFLLLGSQDHSLILWSLEPPNLEEIREWIQSNRHVRELSCKERAQFQIEPLCEEDNPESEAIHVPPPAWQDGVGHPTLDAKVGENQGVIALGDWDVWLYEGQAGEVLTFRMVAGDPAASEEELLGFETVLFVITPDGSLLSMGFDQSGASESLIEGLELPVDGTYQIQARSHKDQSAGPYTLTIEVEEE